MNFQRWPYQSTPYLSALPGVGGPAMDVSNGDKPSKIYFVTSTKSNNEGGSDSARGPNCYSGTFWYCWYADQGEDFSKWIIPLVGGYVHLGRAMNAPKRENFDYIGHAAPGAGLFVQTASLRVQGSNSRIWHLPSWVGDKPSAESGKFKSDQRDALQAGSDGGDVGRVAFINCEARFSMDEAVEIWYEQEGTSWIRGAAYDPLHHPEGFASGDHEEGEDHGFGPIITGKADYSLALQSLYAHTTDRNPLVAAPNHAHINNLHYNHGRPSIGRGEALNISDNGDWNAQADRTMQCNAVGNVSVKGPNQGSEIIFAKVGTVTPGSSGHLALNSVFGWPQPDSQEGMITSHPSDYLRPTLRRGAWPLGMGFNYDGVLRPCRDPLNPRVQELLAFAQLIRTTVGCMPARRYRYKGGVNKVMDQIDARIRGDVSTSSQFIDSVEDAGGWPDVPDETIDPKNPGSDYHAPIPLGADRDDVVLSGTFADGSSKIGYSKLRAWTIDQYFYVLGR